METTKYLVSTSLNLFGSEEEEGVLRLVVDLYKQSWISEWSLASPVGVFCTVSNAQRLAQKDIRNLIVSFS